MYIGHPKKEIRDTSRYKQFRQLTNGRTPSLKKLSAQVLGVSVQEGEHSSVSNSVEDMKNSVGNDEDNMLKTIQKCVKIMCKKHVERKRRKNREKHVEIIKNMCSKHEENV